jgi:hypothetical protein
MYADLMHTTSEYFDLDERYLTQVTVVDGLECFDYGLSCRSFFMIDKRLPFAHLGAKSFE